VIVRAVSRRSFIVDAIDAARETRAARPGVALLDADLSRGGNVLSATLESEAIATVENEAAQTDWVGDLGGGLGVDPAACCGWCSVGAGRSAVGDWVCDGGPRGGVGSAAEVRASVEGDVVYAVRGEGAGDLGRASGDAGDGDRRAGRVGWGRSRGSGTTFGGCGLSIVVRTRLIGWSGSR
jgi:hypothetical protein